MNQVNPGRRASKTHWRQQPLDSWAGHTSDANNHSSLTTSSLPLFTSLSLLFSTLSPRECHRRRRRRRNKPKTKQNLALNVAEKGFPISVYNRSGDKTDNAVARAKKEGLDNLRGYKDMGEFVASLQKPRSVIILVKAGAPVDATIEGRGGRGARGEPAIHHSSRALLPWFTLLH